MNERRRGREGAIEAIVAAARELFAERGPDAVSLRDVARRAGVNHGLIHHYIGTREDLLRLVFAASSEQARREADRADHPVEALQAMRRHAGGNDEYSRLLAWALLEGRDPTVFHGRSPAIDAIAGSGEDSRALRLALAAAMVHTLGWKLFGEYALRAAGLDGEDLAAVRHEVESLVDRLVVEATDPDAALRP